MSTSFPTPVGGSISRSRDLVASIVFAAVHGLLIPVMVYRMVNKRSRTLLILNTLTMLIERTVFLSLRAANAQTNSNPTGISEYMQVSFALGYAGLLQNVGGLLRSVLVDSTKGTDSAFEEVALWTARPSNAPVAPITDQPRRRYYFRRMHEIMQVLSITCVVIGVIGNRAIIADREKPTKSTTNQAMRYFASAITLCISLWIIAVAVWSRMTIPHVNRRATTYIIALASLLSIPGIYRLAVMWNTTHDWPTYTGPGSLNSTGAKAAFYIVHFVPEWVACVIVSASNIREISQCGAWGDIRGKDETAEEKMKREQKEKERETKKEKRRARA